MPAQPIYNVGDTARLEILVRANTTSLAVASAAGATAITVYATDGYAAADTVVIEPSSTPEHAPQETRVVSGSPAPTANVITLTAALIFAHPAGAIVSELVAGTVAATVRLPDGTTSAGSVSNVSTGRYRVDYTTTQAGEHRIEWAVSGAAIAAGVYPFTVLTDTV